MQYVRVHISTKNYYITKKMDIKNPRLVSCPPCTHISADTCKHTYMYLCTLTYAQSLASSCRCTCPRLPRVTRRETSEKRAVEPGSYVCTSRLGSGLHLYPHALPRTPGEPRGPMRQYVPIIFPHTPFHSLALDRDPPPSSLSADTGDIPPFLSPRIVHVNDESFGACTCA